MDAPTAPGIEQTPASCLSPCLLSVGQKLCPEGKPPGSYRIVGASGPGQCIQHPLLMDSISSERLNVGSGETTGLLRVGFYVSCAQTSCWGLRPLGHKSPTPMMMALCPYMSVKPLAGLKLSVVFCCLEDTWENKTLPMDGCITCQLKRSSGWQATLGTT